MHTVTAADAKMHSNPSLPGISIRTEFSGDEQALHHIHRQAFGRREEADLVDRLRAAGVDGLSLIAEADGRAVGHVLFTPVVIEPESGPLRGMGLGPVSVLPEFQRCGIGSRLIEEGLARGAKCGWPFVVVVGDPAYYRRFGFQPASLHGVACEFDGVPDEAFQMVLFDHLARTDIRGLAQYRPEFHDTA